MLFGGADVSTVKKGYILLNGREAAVDDNIYRNWDFGPQVALSAEYSLSENIALGVSLQASYGLPNVENTGPIQILDPRLSSSIGPIYYWKDRVHKALGSLPGVPVDERPPTHTFTAGLLFRLRVTL